MSETHLYLVRHGRTEWNAQGKVQGRIDIPLDETGREEARALAELLSYLPFVAVYASDLLRAKQTADIVANSYQCQVYTDPLLREVSYGQIEGMLWEDFRVAYQEQRMQYALLSKEKRFAHRYTESSESYQEVIDRVIPCLHTIASQHRGKHIMVVCHGGVLKALAAHLGGLDDMKIRVRNTGYFHVVEKENIFHLLRCEGLDE